MGLALTGTIPIFDPLESFRQVVYKAADKWLEKFRDFFEKETPPTLSEISKRFTETRHLFLEACFQGLVEQLAQEGLNQEYADCPKCGRRIRMKRIERKEISIMHGKITISRPYFYCRGCGHGFCPLDETLEIVREVHQLDVQSAISALAADLPYEAAVKHFSALTGIDLSSHFSHKTLNAIGETASLETVIPDSEEIQKRIDEVSSHGDDPIMIVAIDGAYVPTRPEGSRSKKRGPGQYREVKGCRIYLSGPDDRIVHIASWHQIKDASEFSKDFGLIASRIPRDKVTLCLLGDGASWIWNVFKEHFPDGIQILDYYHCSEHVYKVAHSQYGDSLKAREWAESVLARLGLNMATSVIAGLKRMKPVDAEAKEEISNLITYLRNHKDRFGYRYHVDAERPIGSGGIESANKYICHTRLKRSGAWWLKENCNAMLRVRCAIYNGTFDQVLTNYKHSKFNKHK